MQMSEFEVIKWERTIGREYTKFTFPPITDKRIWGFFKYKCSIKECFKFVLAQIIDEWIWSYHEYKCLKNYNFSKILLANVSRR